MKLLNIIKEYLHALFGKSTPHSQPHIEKKKHTKTSHYWTLKNILSRLDAEHKATRIIYKKAHSSLTRSNYKTLRKQGPFILPEEEEFYLKPDMLDERVDKCDLENLPGIIFVGVNGKWDARGATKSRRE